MIAAPTAISLDPPGRRFLWSSIYVGVAVALVACGAVAFRSLTIGSVPGNWYYPYGPPATLRLAAVWLLYSAACAAVVAAGWQLAERYRPLSIVLAWIVLAMGLQWGLRAIAPYPLEAILVSDRANSFYSVAQAYDPAQVLRSFNRVRRERAAARAEQHAWQAAPDRCAHTGSRSEPTSCRGSSSAFPASVRCSSTASFARSSMMIG